MDYGYWGMWGAAGFLMMLLWWALIIVGIVLLVRWLRFGAPFERSPHASSSRRAIDLLEERYVRGEIDRKEYLEKKKDLEQ